MLRIVLHNRIVFYSWITINTFLFIASGYFLKLANVLSLKGINEFAMMHKKIFLFNTYDLKNYDLTEYIVSYLIAVMIFYVSRKFRMSNQNYKVVQTF